ncbi:MAG: hypothetical protein RL497_1497 [Pseudomonadota bacterium]
MGKKILWLSHFLPFPPKGGNLQRSYNLLKEVSKKHEVTLLAFNQISICPSQEEMENSKIQLEKICRVAGIFPIKSDAHAWNRFALGLKSLSPWKTYTMEWLQSREYKKAVNNLINNNHYDIIHVDTISLIPHIKNIKNIKISLTHHNIESDMLIRRSKNETNLIKSCLFFYEGIKLKKIEREICRKADINITCSTLDSNRLANIVPGCKCIDIPNGVDLAYFKPISGKKNAQSLVFAGGLAWYPNLAAMTFFLKSIWPNLTQELPDISMTIIGRSPPDWMKEMQNTYPKLKIAGFVDDVRPYIDAATLYICPINDGGGTKLKILDALAMGKAIIAHPIACEGIDVENNKNIIFAETADQYIYEIKKIINSPEKIKKISDGALKLAHEKYDFVSIGIKLSSIYENL